MTSRYIVNGRFRIPIYWNWAMCIPQPRWLKRWYYKKSYQWWKHPSNHHWKMWSIGCGIDGDTSQNAPTRIQKWWNMKKYLLEGERDLLSGGYCEGNSERK